MRKIVLLLDVGVVVVVVIVLAVLTAKLKKSASLQQND
jgi:CHASE3 domain sensor protein